MKISKLQQQKKLQVLFLIRLETSNDNLLCELETLRENNKNLYSKYNNISRSKNRMRNIITEKDEKITQLENKIKELLENKKNYTESKDLSDDWVSLD